MPYLKLFTSEFRTLTERMSDAARGRLIMAMINYIENGIEPILSGDESDGEEPTLLEESMVWPTAKARMDDQIDAYCDKVDSAASAREAKRGRKNSETRNKNSEIRNKKTEIKDENSEIRNKTLKTTLISGEEQEHIQEQEHKDIIPPISPPSSAVLSPEREKMVMDEDYAEVVKAWDKASAHCVTMAEGEDLQDMLQKYGKERLLKAIKVAVRNNAVKLVYVRAVLEGQGKARSPDPRPEEDHILDGIL